MATANDRKAAYDARKDAERSKKEAEKLREAREKRLSTLLTVYRETSNHLREKNEDLLLAAIFESLDLPYIFEASEPKLPVGVPFEGEPGEVFLSPEDLEDINASAAELVADPED